MDDLDDGLLARRPRRGHLRRGPARAAAADEAEQPEMTASTIFVLLLVLACPLMMVLMMRGHGRHAGSRDQEAGPREASTDELRRRRAELDRLIEEREQGSERQLTSSGWRR